MAYKALDIAKKLIKRAELDEPNGGELMSNLKLQKLLYYQQGYHLAIMDSPLFDDNIEAWMYGPVVPNVYDAYSRYGASPLPIENDVINMEDEEERLFNQVYESFADFSAIGLMNRTHSEKPWLSSLPHDRGTVISQQLIKEFFLTQVE